MARKCDTAKYRTRAAKQRRNRGMRLRRQRAREAQWAALCRKRREEAEAARLADPRRREIQKLANVLQTRLSSMPLYRFFSIAKLLGVDAEALFDQSVRFAREEMLAEP